MPAHFFGGDGPIRLDINADTTNYNIYTQGSPPARPVSVVLTIAAGVKVGHLSTGSGWAAGSKIRIAYAGARIAGAGGDAGNGAPFHISPFDGQAAGVALSLGWNVELDWGSTGELFGGGGGGAGGSTAAAGGGGGGGGGQGYPGGNGGSGANAGVAGGDGSNNAPGIGGINGDLAGTKTSGNGGSWGQKGKDNGTATGGAAGKAIDLNGHTVTWIGGTPGSANLKGAVS